MPFTRVHPDDTDAVQTLVALTSAADAIDDPGEPVGTVADAAGWLEFGWDLEPSEVYLYTPDGGTAPVARMNVNAPRRDNLQVLMGGVLVHPDHRRRGHGTAVLAEVLRQARDRGRSIVWASSRHGDPAGAALLSGHGFAPASRGARRLQVLAEVDAEAVESLHAAAVARSGDYRLERYAGVPNTDELLGELIEVTASINDAPMGDLSFEPEQFDLQRLRDFETSVAGRGSRLYRLIARHAETGEVGGHTIVAAQDTHPHRADQYDTAVHRDHRGHRLGALLKIEMMRWLAETEPQVTEIVTWNNADNDFMISINEAIGYRLTGLWDEWELRLDR